MAGSSTRSARRRRQAASVAWSLAALWLSAACAPRAREYPLRGQVIAVHRDRQELTVRHEDIPGFMPAMTMPFRVEPAHLLDGCAPGDLVTGTLVVADTDAYLTALTKVGWAPLPDTAAPAPTPNAVEPLRVGDPVPDQAFVDQAGRPRRLSSWRGRALALTFIYTRCPYPTFCPLMDRHFATIQRRLAAEPALAARVHLLTVSFDPDYDTPAVLARHAAALGADPERWSFVTAPRAEVDRFAGRFGVAIVRGATAADFAHTLRTAVIDPEGRLASLYPGNEWTPDEILRDLRHATGLD
jgi:protein SCO1/2